MKLRRFDFNELTVNFSETSLVMLTATERQKFLQTIPIFAGLNEAALSELSRAAGETEYQTEDVIVREGESGDRMFIIHSGRVEVVKYLGSAKETVLAVFGPRDFLGEMSIIECVTRSASLRALDRSFLFALKGLDLYRLYCHQPDQYAIVILNIARDLSRRLRAIDERFTAISH
jgi:CRP/FNR family transcriptional regulator, cyclic AMP receptor protein